MNGSHVKSEAALLSELSAANLALVSGVRMRRSATAAVALSMRRVVVSADRCGVAERHVADLTLDPHSRCLKPKQ